MTEQQAPKLPYEPELYVSKEEQQLLKSVFEGKPELLKVLRKLFIPTFSDPDFPIEALGNDLFIQGRDWSQIPSQDRGELIVARQEAVKYVVNGLVNLKMIINQKEESEDEKQERQKKDSSK